MNLFSAHSVTCTRTMLAHQVQEPTYNYLVRIINPAKRSDYVTRTWHGVTDVFDSPTAIRQKLKESFPDKLSADFQIGYIEKRCNSKRWIEEPADCKAMYDSYRKGDKITLWCVSIQDTDSDAQPAKGRKRKKRDEDKQTSKRDVHESEVDKVFHELRSKHGDDYTGPQYRVWSRMIVNKIHDSLEEPPNIPIITGEIPRGKRKKTCSSDSISEALIGAAAAVTKYLATDGSGNQTPSPSTPPRKSSNRIQAVGVSPLSKAKLSDQYITQLQRLQSLLDNNVLTPEEFAEQKTYTLTNLRSLNRQD